MADQPDDPTIERRRPPHMPAVNLDVIAFQVGSLQTSLDRGLLNVEKTLERHTAEIGKRLDKIEDRLSSQELRAERHEGRIVGLEEFRVEQEARMLKEQEALVTASSTTSADAETLRTYRLLGKLAIGGLGLLVTVLTILTAVGAIG